MSGERVSVWEDPNVVAAFKAGRTADDIYVLNCPRCGELSYYNQGSSFTCRHCDVGYTVLSEDEDCDGLRVDVFLTMADVAAAECEDYP